jgi:NADPH:quinone reductase-like Zn-dependent oxidoreductase
LPGIWGPRSPGVCGTANLEFVKSLGAEKVIDYTKENFTQRGDSYDVIFDAVGKRASSRLEGRRALTPRGKYLSVDDGTPRITIEDLLALRELMEAGHIRSVIDRRYPLPDLAEAHRYVEGGHKRGGVAITVGQGERERQMTA